jgi:eukaryotic-like serine/threonine-protein kinase
MSSKQQYQPFGSYLLFRKLETDAMGDLWRAGEIAGEVTDRLVVVRTLRGGDRAALTAAAEHARAVAAALTGTTLVRNQKAGVTDGIPWVAFDYPGGRSLAQILRAAAADGQRRNPIPIDQAVSIVEKLALSAETLNTMRYQGSRLAHGALIPQFVWISDEGEVRTFGQQWSSGLLQSLGDPAVAAELLPYFAPELRGGAEASKAGDVWSLGALFFVLLTGMEPPSDPSAVEPALSAARLAAGDEPIPAEIRSVIRTAMQGDPAKRYASAAEFRKAVDQILGQGDFAATTFNLAFYLTSLLREELAQEQKDSEMEQRVAVAPYLRGGAATAAPVASAAPPRSPFAATADAGVKTRRTPLYAIAAVLSIVLLGTGFFMMNARSTEQPAPQQVAASVLTPLAAPAALPIEPIVATSDEPAALAPGSEDAKQKAIEEEINKRLQEELMKLQADYDRELRRQQQAAARAESSNEPPPPAPTPTEASAAAQADAARRAQQLAGQQLAAQQIAAQQTAALTQSESSPTPASPPPAAAQQATPVAQAVPPPVTATPVPTAPATAVRAGDLVAVGELDQMPERRSPIRPEYPPIARMRKIEATVLLSVLINESGAVEDVRILRGDTTRLGFDDAAIKAVRAATFSAPMKDGRPVKTWMPLPVVFKLQ